MNITEFLSAHAADSVKSDIIERWESRIVAGGLHMEGRRGAEAYLAQYGKGMKTPKCIGFARCAELKGFPQLAAAFWEQAFFLETGRRANVSGGTVVSDACLPTPLLRASFGHRPQLLVPVNRERALSLARERSYGIQEKKDGERVMVEVKASVLRAGNKKGLERFLPLKIAEALLSLKRDFVIDGELVGTTYWVFDLLSVDGVDMRGNEYWRRDLALNVLLGTHGDRDFVGAVQVVQLVTSQGEKLGHIEQLERGGKEGFVIKLLSAPYVAGDAHQTQWKFQFRATVPVIVGGRNGDKDSVEVFVLRADGSRRSMGSVTIPADQPFPTSGEVAEVQSLYVHPGPEGKFAQPVFKGVRSDADESDCQEAKLRVKANGPA
jgi:hypothetical protein